MKARWFFFLLLSLSCLALLASAVPGQNSGKAKLADPEPADAAEVRRQMALIEKLEGVVPDRGAALYFLAASKQHLGETPDALKTLKECIALREGFDPSAGPSFTGVKNSKEFQDLVEAVHRDFPVVAQGQVAFVTDEKDLVPEGLAYDAAQSVFYLSSLNRRKIIKIAADGKVTDFVPADRYHLLPVLGIRPDPTDSTVWANSFSELGKTELLHFNSSGELLGRYSPRDKVGHGFNDLVVRENGEVIVTDSLSGRIYRFDRSSHAFTSVTVHRALSYPNGIALANDDRQLFIADDLGVIRVDLLSNVSADVNPGPRNTLAGIDGLYWRNGALVAVQNAIGAPRVAMFRLSKDGLRVMQTVVLENRSALTITPTTGAIKGNDFYFIVNGQGDNMTDDKVIDPRRLESVRIGVVHLP